MNIMGSLLGGTSSIENLFEIHALTYNLPFGDYSQSEISDPTFFYQIYSKKAGDRLHEF